jgi:hypothetical protein
MVRAERPSPARVRGDSGAAAVEFALVLPLLFVLLFGIIEFGFGLFQMQAAQATVREAARTVAVGIDSCTSFDTIVGNAARNNGLGVDLDDPGTNARLTFEAPPDAPPGSPTGPERGDTAVVSLTYQPTLDFPLIPFPDTITREAGVIVEDVGTLDRRSCG